MWTLLLVSFLTAVTVQTGAASYGLFDRERFAYRGRSSSSTQQQQQSLNSKMARNSLYSKNSIRGSYEEPAEPVELSQEEMEILENKDCCPSVTELIHPLAGVSRNGMILEIYRGDNKTQKFYQTSCRREVKDRPCRFVRSKYELASRCTQEYSYTYAIIRDVNSEGQWRMDHIRVRSGCNCKVTKVTRTRKGEVRKKRK